MISVPRPIWILGNGPISGQLIESIDEGSQVVVFNNCKHQLRSDFEVIHWLNVTGKQSHRDLIQGKVESWVARTSASLLVTSRPPVKTIENLRNLILFKRDMLNFARHYSDHISSIPVNFPDPSLLKLLIEVLEKLVGEDVKHPSTGLVAIHQYTSLSTHKVNIAGFGFEGWKGHCWDAESAYVTQLIEKNRVIFHQ